MAYDAGMLSVASKGRRRLGSDHYKTPVTTRDGHIVTEFGGILFPHAIRSIYGDLCSDEALDVLCRAWHVALADPEWAATIGCGRCCGPLPRDPMNPKEADDAGRRVDSA